ncbi:Vasoactive intestinal polypeptide [Scophthalmus maximus]|uniref:Vasoactive intestinal polypeptide n=1 Tax=Scophthalmus maximus TaxID=52904 RepID=A0A2U9CDL3_SCOMX|nr:Vasoactive intestinal polypeptide [Scophthalmus maximus]
MRNIQVYKTLGPEICNGQKDAVRNHRINRSGHTAPGLRPGPWRAPRIAPNADSSLSSAHIVICGGDNNIAASPPVKCKAMLQRTGPQLLLLIALCSVLYSRTLSLPYTSMRPTRHADGLFTSGYSKLLGQLSARRYLESLIGKRVSDELMEEPVKRHSDAIFTDNYSRFRKQMAVKKYLNSVLTGKRSLEDPGASDPEESRDDPNTFQESYDDINVDHLLNNFQLVAVPDQ